MTYSCVAHADNQRSFNDGYHVQHHLNSRLHWSELPARFLETMPLHAAADGAQDGVSVPSRLTCVVTTACPLDECLWTVVHTEACTVEVPLSAMTSAPFS